VYVPPEVQKDCTMQRRRRAPQKFRGRPHAVIHLLLESVHLDPHLRRGSRHLNQIISNSNNQPEPARSLPARARRRRSPRDSYAASCIFGASMSPESARADRPWRKPTAPRLGGVDEVGASAESEASPLRSPVRMIEGVICRGGVHGADPVLSSNLSVHIKKLLYFRELISLSRETLRFAADFRVAEKAC
jgi:hypothetical protein